MRALRPAPHDPKVNAKVNDPENGQWKLGSTARVRTSIYQTREGGGGGRERERRGRQCEWSRVWVLTLILTNAFVVFWKLGGGEEGEVKERNLPTGEGESEKKVLDLGSQDFDKLYTNDVEKFAVRIQRPRLVKGHGLQSFVFLSGYRTGFSSFSALGFGAVPLRNSRIVKVCKWESENGKIFNGTITPIYPGEIDNLRYETLILVCNLDTKNVLYYNTKFVNFNEKNANFDGQNLNLDLEKLNFDTSNVNLKTKFTKHSESLTDEDLKYGKLKMVIDKSEVLIFEEKNEKENAEKKKNPQMHNLTLCSPPLHSTLSWEHVREWMEFHRTIHTVDYFVFYDAGGVDGEGREVLDPFVRREGAVVVSVRETALYETWQHGQVLFANDCLYRTKHTSRWTLFLDFDEYLSLSPSPSLSLPHATQGHPLSLLVYLQEGERGGKGGRERKRERGGERGRERFSWMSFGSILYSVTHCSGEKSDFRFAIESLPFHEPEAHCKNLAKFRNRNFCLERAGHRKFVLRPQEVQAVQIYSVLNSSHGGIDAPTNEIRLNHFRGLVDQRHTVCRFVWEKGALPPRLVLDSSVVDLAALARKRHSLSWFAD